ncbi:hypothetical protein [Flavobacterium sp. GT3R68]|uniref:hypothetical protein n=1 Tax=Flavobacterium sp. GT3R68 TaxID=2594437 RepID=UPI000F893567|nr:hypothetical protein [Flavobacterium sp. GT3R68]RTY95037.1 hypothetical protein EKL32_08960 [Flavobacterium sp. GSN2]TRW91843.1 hypothetical protein FNW07_08135 [Flavobacterium sp. GT3R68]
MKTLKLIAVGIILFASSMMQAQVAVNVNIGKPPVWGPVGYSEVEYYYLPDVESYYDVRENQFIYFGDGRWVRSRNLPRQYRNYDLYSGYKVVLHDYHGRTPYTYYKKHKVKYYKGYKGAPQRTIGVRGESHGNNGHHGNNDNHGNSGHHDNHGNKGEKGHGKGKGKH